MKKIIFLVLVAFTTIACKNNSEIEVQESVVSSSTMSKSDSDQKLIDVCKSMEGILDADIKDDILTVKANMSKDEAQKLSDGMLREVKKYNPNINTVIVCDIGYKLLGHSGK